MNLMIISINLIRGKVFTQMKYMLILLFMASLTQLYGQNFKTQYEKSGYTETATYEETMDYCRHLAATFSEITMRSIGQSSRGFDIPLLIIDKAGLSHPDSIKQSGRTVVMVQSGIHPGESEGKDAMMTLLRDVFVDDKHPDLFRNVSVLWLPMFNADGENRFGSYNRINQNGPEKMGWRTNSLNLNLNRDYMKADSPEMRHWLELWNAWLPDFFVDCHTTNGADYQYELTYAMEVYGQMDKELTKWQKEEYIDEVMPQMFEAGFPVFPYVSFRKWHDPRSGLKTAVFAPRISQGYTAVQNRPGLLIETHMLKPYKNRVESTRKMIEFTLEHLNSKGEQLQRLNRKADDKVASPAFREVPFVTAYKLAEQDSTMVDFRGVNYHHEKSDLTGGNWFRYHNDEDTTFSLPWFKTNLPDKEIQLPEAYLIPPEFEGILKRLKAHGVEFSRLAERDSLMTEHYHFTNYSWRSSPYEGRMTMPQREYRSVKANHFYPEGTAVVPLNQRTARVIAQILEPSAPDSYVFWGFFNAFFEQKEYAESYVMEKEARKMLQERPGMKQAFETWKEENPEAAKNQWAQLNWFYKQSPYWDEKKDVYPVGRLLDASQLDDPAFRKD
ncbi:MAG: M14 family metallopeptidase [Bacteroidota bacterium]